MSLFDEHPGLRWAVPAGAAGLIVAGVVVTPLVATADPGLPPRTAKELLVALQTAEPVPVSGTIATSAELGLPDLPMGMAGDGPASLATGDRTLRLWTDGPERQRLALIDDSAETTIVRNGDVAWLWSSANATADRYVLPEHDAALPDDTDLPEGVMLPSTPQEAAELALEAVDPTTEVTTSGLNTIAGRDAYELVLTPRDATTLVARVTLSLDAETMVPLQARVDSTKLTDPAFQVGFTAVDFGTPDAALFEFTPPEGATVTEHDVAEHEAPSVEGRAISDTASEPTAVGKGWSTVVIAELPTEALADLAEQGSQAPEEWGSDDPAATALALLEALPAISGDWGSGRVLAGTLFSVIVTDDGRVAAGAVPPDTVGAALSAR